MQVVIPFYLMIFIDYCIIFADIIIQRTVVKKWTKKKETKNPVSL
jgi:hypothetical protein